MTLDGQREPGHRVANASGRIGAGRIGSGRRDRPLPLVSDQARPLLDQVDSRTLPGSPLQRPTTPTRAGGHPTPEGVAVCEVRPGLRGIRGDRDIHASCPRDDRNLLRVHEWGIRARSDSRDVGLRLQKAGSTVATWWYRRTGGPEARVPERRAPE
ncbi:MAG: hypothetical protein ACRELC_04005, partial [Gemmatimonadota bacterium]